MVGRAIIINGDSIMLCNKTNKWIVCVPINVSFSLQASHLLFRKICHDIPQKNPTVLILSGWRECTNSFKVLYLVFSSIDIFGRSITGSRREISYPQLFVIKYSAVSCDRASITPVMASGKNASSSPIKQQYFPFAKDTTLRTFRSNQRFSGLREYTILGYFATYPDIISSVPSLLPLSDTTISNSENTDCSTILSIHCCRHFLRLYVGIQMERRGIFIGFSWTR